MSLTTIVELPAAGNGGIPRAATERFAEPTVRDGNDP